MVVGRPPLDHRTRPSDGIRGVVVVLWIAAAFFLGLSIGNQLSVIDNTTTTLWRNIEESSARPNTILLPNTNCTTSTTTTTIGSSAHSKLLLPVVVPETKPTATTTYYSGFNSTTTIQSETTTTAVGLGTRIVYLSQGPAKSYPVWKKLVDAISEKKNAVFLYHSYDEDCEGCLYQAGTTLSEGRNLVVFAAAKTTDWNTYKYVVVLLDSSTSTRNSK
jgi:hypothetical protein